MFSFILGSMLGGIFGVGTMCMLQINNLKGGDKNDGSENATDDL